MHVPYLRLEGHASLPHVLPNIRTEGFSFKSDVLEQFDDDRRMGLNWHHLAKW